MAMNPIAIIESWETLASMARGLLDEQDRQRWALGEIVDNVQTHYGDESLLKFAGDVKGNPKTLYQYRQVFRFYPRDTWKDYPLVRYTQWRDAMRLKDSTRALELISWANDENIRMVDFYAKLDAMAGKINSTASKLFDKVVVISTDGDTVTFVCDAVLVEGVPYQITIREATDV